MRVRVARTVTSDPTGDLCHACSRLVYVAARWSWPSRFCRRWLLQPRPLRVLRSLLRPSPLPLTVPRSCRRRCWSAQIARPRFVRFVVAGQVERTVAVSGGSAVTEIPVHGLDGSTSIEAYDCASPVSCGVSADSITVDVELTPPTITAPSRNDFVGNCVTVKVKSGVRRNPILRRRHTGRQGPRVPLDAKRISLKDRNEGEHILMVQQCNTDGSICEGETDSVKVIKDTKAPRWTEVRASNKTVFPVNDNYKDSTRLSARLSENAAKASIEIRKAGGPIVRTLNLGREGSGRVSANWNGRKANGDIVPSGRYTFRFVGKGSIGSHGQERCQEPSRIGQALGQGAGDADGQRLG